MRGPRAGIRQATGRCGCSRCGQAAPSGPLLGRGNANPQPEPGNCAAGGTGLFCAGLTRSLGWAITSCSSPQIKIVYHHRKSMRRLSDNGLTKQIRLTNQTDRLQSPLSHRRTFFAKCLHLLPTAAPSRISSVGPCPFRKDFWNWPTSCLTYTRKVATKNLSASRY